MNNASAKDMVREFEVTTVARVYAKNIGAAIVLASHPEIQRSIKNVKEVKS